MSPIDPGCVKTHTLEKCRKYNSPTRHPSAYRKNHQFSGRAISPKCFYARSGRWSFYTAKTHSDIASTLVSAREAAGIYPAEISQGSVAGGSITERIRANRGRRELALAPCCEQADNCAVPNHWTNRARWQERAAPRTLLFKTAERQALPVCSAHWRDDS